MFCNLDTNMFSRGYKTWKIENSSSRERTTWVLSHFIGTCLKFDKPYILDPASGRNTVISDNVWTNVKMMIFNENTKNNGVGEMYFPAVLKLLITSKAFIYVRVDHMLRHLRYGQKIRFAFRHKVT